MHSTLPPGSGGSARHLSSGGRLISQPPEPGGPIRRYSESGVPPPICPPAGGSRTLLVDHHGCRVGPAVEGPTPDGPLRERQFDRRKCLTISLAMLLGVRSSMPLR
jgi:hypothetical protein